MLLFLLLAGNIIFFTMGMNMVCINMNKAYMMDKGKNQKFSAEEYMKSSNSNEVCIPVFFMLERKDPYVFNISVMGSGFEIDMEKIIDNMEIIKARLSYYIGWILNILTHNHT